MDTILQALFSWQFLFLCLGLSAIVQVIKVIAEYAMANWATAAKESKLWRDLILPILPILLGLVCGLFLKQYPWPEGATSPSAHAFIGLVAGMSSGLVFRMYKTFLGAKVSDFASRIAGNSQSQQASGATTDCPPASDDKDLESSVRDSIKKD